MELPDAKAAATDILRRARQERPPVNLDVVVRLWPELTVTSSCLDREGYLIDLGRLGAEILVRGDDNPRRKRFTIAHELGHWVLRPTLATEPRSILPSTAVEKWCDTFATALLMPEDWVLRDVRGIKPSGILSVALLGSDRYDVSNEAFQLRVSELTPLSIFRVKGLEGGLSVEKAFQTTHVPTAVVNKTLKRVLRILSTGCLPGQYRHRDTGLLSVHKLMFRGSNESRWLVGIIPMQGHRGCP